MSLGLPFQGVLFTVFQSIFQVFLLCLAGFVLSFKGIVDKPTSKVLNHMNIALFTPALLFSKVAFFLTPAKLRQLWIIPIFFTVVTTLSAVIAHWLARAFRLKRSQVNFATAASMFMNSNSLPVALMQSLASTVPLLKWGPDDTIDAMFGRSLTYLVVFSTLGMMLRWSYGVHLISLADEPESATPAHTTYRDVDDTSEQPPFIHVTVNQPAPLIDYETETDVGTQHRMPWRTHPLRSRLPHPRFTPTPRRHVRSPKHPHSHLPAVPTSLGDQSESGDSDELETTEGDSEDTIALQSEPIDTGFSTEVEDPASAPTLAPSASEPAAQSTPRWGQRPRPFVLSIVARFLTILTSLSPPLVASLFALFCVLVPPIQRFLISPEMIPFSGALNEAGGCSIPITLIVLGGWFWDGGPKPKDESKRVEEVEVKTESDGQVHAKSKGKGVESPHNQANRNGVIRTVTHASTTENGTYLGHHMSPCSRDSSATSIASMIGDVFKADIHSHGSLGRTRQRTGENAGASKADHDVESGLSVTPTETANENAENRLGRFSRSRSKTDAGCPQPSSVSSSPTSPVSTPKSRGKNPPGESLTVFVALLARMIIVPIVVTPMMVLVRRLGWGGEVFEDPVFIVSSMLLLSSPPALTLAQISQRTKSPTGADADANADADAFSPFERLLSRTVFWSYCVLTPPVTIASVMIGLMLIGA